MLGFWWSDAVLVIVQAAVVCGPRPRLPQRFVVLRSSMWSWFALPAALAGTVALLAVAPGVGAGYAWVSAVGVPAACAVALAAGLRPSRLLRRGVVAVLVTVTLLTVAWGSGGTLVGEAAAVALTALSACTVGAYLSQLGRPSVVKLVVVVTAVLDSVLVFGSLLEAPNQTLNAASPGLDLPHLQAAFFGSAVLGYGDLLAAAVLGQVVGGGLGRVRAAGLLLACSAVFDLLFLVRSTIPATVPVAATLVLLELGGRVRRARARRVGGGPAVQCPRREPSRTD